MFWQRFPLFRIFIAYCLGILWANFLPTSFFWFGIAFIVFLLSIFVLGYWRKVFSSYKQRWWFGLSLSMLFLTFGVMVSHLYTEKLFANHFRTVHATKGKYVVQLLDDLHEKQHSYGGEVRLLSEVDSTRVKESSTKMMLYLEKSPSATELHYGDRVLIDGTLDQLRPPMNPYEFDYRNYLNLKAIYYQAYVKDDQWQYISAGHGFWLMAYAKRLRRYLISIINQWHLNPDEKAVTKALLLGYRYDINDDLLKAYASAGAMHVLAVSGLHVGIVYLIAGFLLGFFKKVKYGLATRSVILVTLLWCYALLTGLSASVVRAATMFTFVAIGSGFDRKTSVYNTILGSALLLLLIKPVYLFEVGFQLSYAAVFGIVWMQPHLQNIWQPPNKVLKLIWSIVTVSVAAQAATFPLALYYFHQFPALFLVSNLLVIPLVSLLMYIGILALFISVIYAPVAWLIHIYELVLHFMNNSVRWIEQQTFFLINHIQISRLELCLLYILILITFTWMRRGGFYRLVLCMSLVVAFLLSQLWEDAQIQQHREMVVYATGSNLALGFYKGNKGVFIADSALSNNDDALTFHIKHHWWAHDIEKLKTITPDSNYRCDFFCKRGNLLDFRHKWVWLCNSMTAIPVKANLWIINGAAYPPDSALKLKNLDVVWVKGAYGQAKAWHDWCQKFHFNFWDVKANGAFVLN